VTKYSSQDDIDARLDEVSLFRVFQPFNVCLVRSAWAGILGIAKFFSRNDY
jgi:hypothetical protein